jgi:FKBP-type peptidyl-prolyl cis-trans isomerase 2
MRQAKLGDTVKVNYTGKLDDGTVVATSIGRKPLEFVIGRKRIIAGLEEAVVGMRPGETRTVKVPANKAFGAHHENMVRTVNRSKFPVDPEPKAGQRFEMTEGDWRTAVVTVKEVSGSKVALDTNHPLAGEDVTFDIELIDIAQPSSRF